MRRLLAPVIGLLLVVLAATPALAVETNYQNPVTAAPPVSRPDTSSCTETVMQHAFAFSYGQPFVGSYTPPAGCPGPWSKVVLDWTGSVAGRQYDRIAGVWIGGVEMLRTSTPEPSPAGITWHVAKDVSEYAPVLSQPQTVVVDLGNLVNSTYTGIYDITMTLTFYQTDAQNRPASHPDQVVPISTSTTNSAWYFLGDSSATASKTVNLPSNLTRAYLEVYASAHSCDEFWYANQPSDYASAKGLCGGSAFREIEVFIDGRLAGVTWPYPIVYTGGWNPYLWRPIPGVNAFNIPPYVVNLTPFVGALTDGNPHTISVQVVNNQGYWLVDGDLLLYRDSGSASTSGALTTDDASADAAQTVNERPSQNGGTFDTSAGRSLTFTGYVDTSAGRVTTRVHQDMSFANSQTLDLLNGLENLKSTENITTTTTTTDSHGTTIQNVQDSYPISGSSAFQIPNHGTGAEFILPAEIQQALYRTVSTTVNGSPGFSSSLSDEIHAKAQLIRDLSNGTNDVANGQTTEHYVYDDSTGACYNHLLSASQGYVTTDTLTATC